MQGERLKDRISRHMGAIHSVQEDPEIYGFQEIAGGANDIGGHTSGVGDGVRNLKPKLCPGCGSLNRSFSKASGSVNRSGDAVSRSGRGPASSTNGLMKAGKQTSDTYWEI